MFRMAPLVKNGIVIVFIGRDNGELGKIKTYEVFW